MRGQERGKNKTGGEVDKLTKQERELFEAIAEREQDIIRIMDEIKQQEVYTDEIIVCNG